MDHIQRLCPSIVGLVDTEVKLSDLHKIKKMCASKLDLLQQFSFIYHRKDLDFLETSYMGLCCAIYIHAADHHFNEE